MKAPVAMLAAGLRGQLARLGIECADQGLLEGVANAQRERAKTLKEMAQGSLFFFRDFGEYEPKAAKKNLGADALPVLEALGVALAAVADWKAGPLHEALNSVATRLGLGLGKVAQPLRVAVTGGAVSPPIDLTLALLGRERVMMGLERARRYALEA
jgi:glutamyl-tRNA synthetase